MRKSNIGYFVVGVVTASLAILVAWFAISFTSRPFGSGAQSAGQAQPSPKTVDQAGGVAAPAVQPLGSQAGGQGIGNQWVRLGPLQKGVKPSQATVHLNEEVATDFPSYSTTHFHVNAGQIVSLTLRNDSNPKYHYQHGWVLVKPGTEQQMEVAAEEAGPQRGWIPSSPDVLAFTPLLDPGASDTITFRAPSKPGLYPFFCPFPGHARMMHGMLQVSGSS